MLRPIIKYPGGKQRELKYILPKLPPTIERYFEPFIGGGAVYFSMPSTIQEFYINDKSRDLMNMYILIKDKNKQFISILEEINAKWLLIEEFSNKYYTTLEVFLKENLNKGLEGIKVSDARILQELDPIIKFYNEELLVSDVYYESFYDDEVFKTFKRKIQFLTRSVKKDSELSVSYEGIIETSLKSIFYMYMRKIFNDAKQFIELHVATYIFIREYAYSSMFRYNSKGEFNVPYGGNSYNKKSLRSKIDYIKSEELQKRLQKTTMGIEDFEVFLNKYKLTNEDFVFLDPPYDSEFSTYANNEFAEREQIRLASYLKEKCSANWMLVIKETELIRELYKDEEKVCSGKRLYVNDFDTEYQVNFKNRNKRKVNHLIITNYSQ